MRWKIPLYKQPLGLLPALGLCVLVAKLVWAGWNGVDIASINGAAVSGWNGATIVGAGGGGACDILQADQGGDSYDDEAYFTFYAYQAGTFTTGESGYTACRAEIYGYRVGTPTGNITLEIWTSNAGNPGTLVGTGSAAVDKSTVATSPGWIEFTGLSAALSASTTYYAVVRSSTTDSGTGNAIILVLQSGTGTRDASTDGSSWDAQTARDIGVRLYSD